MAGERRREEMEERGTAEGSRGAREEAREKRIILVRERIHTRREGRLKGGKQVGIGVQMM